jgi:hypothetical protein
MKEATQRRVAFFYAAALAARRMRILNIEQGILNIEVEPVAISFAFYPLGHRNQQSTINNQQSTINNQQSTIKYDRLSIFVVQYSIFISSS